MTELCLVLLVVSFLLGLCLLWAVGTIRKLQISNSVLMEIIDASVKEPK